MPETSADEEGAVTNLVQLGSDLVGGVGGAGLGFIMGGPGGAIAGQAVGVAASHALRAAGSELKRRFMSRRQEVRVGGLLAAAAEEIAERMSAGAGLRTDDFFDLQAGRSTAEEVIERALVVARDETEERKVKLLGRLLAGICFDASVTREQANNLLRTAERASYRQLNLLILFAQDECRAILRTGSYRDVGSMSLELINLLDEIYVLVNQGLLSNGGTYALGLVDIQPAAVTTQGVGAQIFNLARLWHDPDYAVLSAISRTLAIDVDPRTAGVV